MAKRLAIIFGATLVLVGLLGFVPNPIIGRDGLFMTNPAHDLVHMLLGIILIITGTRTESASITTLLSIGGVYALLALLGFAQIGNEGHGTLLGMAHINGADNWLHVALAVLLIGSGLAARRGHGTLAHTPSR
jgi:hypothetical protein